MKKERRPDTSKCKDLPKIKIPNEHLIYRVLQEKSDQIKRGECPEPYPLNPLPRPSWYYYE